MRQTSQWYETLFGELYGRILGGRRHERHAAREAAMIKRLLRLRRGQRVLDCPCGFGRIARGLAALGLKVTGADLSARYIRSARRRASRRGLKIRFVRCDMRELPFEGEFDAVVNWFTSFGYFDEAGNLAAAKAAFAALRPGGRLLVEILNKSWLIPRFTRHDDSVVSGVRVVRRSRWDRQGRRAINTWTFSKGRRRETHHFSHYLYTARELRALLRRAGFRATRLLDGRTGGRLTRHSRRMIAVARKPAKSGRPGKQKT